MQALSAFGAWQHSPIKTVFVGYFDVLCGGALLAISTIVFWLNKVFNAIVEKGVKTLQLI